MHSNEHLHEKTLNRISKMFDAPVLQNNLRGLYVEAMIAELLGTQWYYKGSDWGGWDFENASEVRIEVKQSAKQQSWGCSKGQPRFSIAIAKGHYEGDVYIPNDSCERLADCYIFAWHPANDQRRVEQWEFYIVSSKDLPIHGKSIGLSIIQKVAVKANSNELLPTLDRIVREFR